MRILGPLLLVLVLAVQPAGAHAHARAETLSCDADDRRATFQGDMSERPGSARMQMRFVLRTLDGGRWVRVKAAGFQEWHTADPGVRRYVYTRTVEELPAPGSYRARVVFRWLDDSGSVVARKSRRTEVCRMPDPRPDLVPVSVVERPGGGWAVVVRNSGRSQAGGFLVAATVDGVEQPRQEVAGLEPDQEVAVPFDGPCTGRVLVTVDDEDAVEERDESDNVLDAPCPPLG